MIQNSRMLAEMINLATVAGCQNFEVGTDAILSSRVNPESGAKQLLIINTGDSSIAHKANIENFKTIFGNAIDFNPNPSVPEHLQDDPISNAVANLRDGGISEKDVLRIKDVNRGLNSILKSGVEMEGHVQTAVAMAVALNEGSLYNTKIMEDKTLVTETEFSFEDDGMEGPVNE